jgi:ADP-heptose:LPS heptosyltransferase/glycosyltransferase involved in cell wall biosynthesis/2-polyprenyl-3-methyl-5-hydroxy-6-metoxy-1,4-benzoquinol methylase
MRILASNPDTLGDLILRQPLYAALRAGGHELMLLVRPSAAEAAAFAAPGAAVVELPYEPYAGDVAEQWGRFEPAVRAALDFGPDLLLVAPYRWTAFEEHLAAAMPPGVTTAGMSGHLFGGDPRAGNGGGAGSTLQFDITADVNADEPEVEKNARLAAAMGAPVGSVDPVIAPTEAGLARAARTLQRLGLDGSDFRVVCVTGTAHVALKTWPADKWAEFLATWAARRPERRFLLTGLRSERADAEAVIARLPRELAARCAVWAESGGTLDELVALTSLAEGYVGHDTGPMHVAAALGKPVIGVFGGGTWPRFVPAVSPSVAVMVGVPCVGCGWSCSFETSHCIKDVPVDAVLQAADDLESGRVTGRERRELEPARELLVRMTREAAGIVQREVRLAARAGRDLVSAHRARQVEADEAARARDEARQAREGSAAFEAANRRLTREAEALRADVEGLRREQASLAAQAAAQIAALTTRLETQTAAVQRVADDAVGFMDSAASADWVPAPAEAPAPDSTADEAEEVRKLRLGVARLKGRISELTPRVKRRPPRRPLGQVVTQWITGRRHYAASAPRPIPRVTIVTPSLNDAARLRRTIESVAAQDFQDLEFVVVDGGSTDETGAVLSEFKSRIDRLVAEPDDGPLHAAAKGLELARGDVLHVLFAGDVIEPGGVLRAAEYFSRHPGASAAYFEDAAEAPEGWRFAPPRGPHLDVYTLLRSRERVRHGVWFRRDAYERIGKLSPALGRAADWELYVRMDRRWGLRRGRGQVRTVGPRTGQSDAAYRADLARARDAFLPTFGLAGRLRCGAIHAANRAWGALDGVLRFDRMRFGFRPSSSPLPAVERPPFVPGQPLCPLTNRHPDRLLFSSPDTHGGDRGLNTIYYCGDARAAVTYPPIALERLNALYERRARASRGPVVPPPAGTASPFAAFTGSRLSRLLSHVPSPAWWFTKPRFGDTTADDLLAALSDLTSRDDAGVRVLVVGCFEGQVLDALKARTKWRLAGTDTNDRAIALARHKGHTVWDASPMDAASTIPVGEPFDVLFLNSVAEHLQDPLLVVRRLRQMLAPGGLIVVNQPNLDSALLTLYGPTWAHWQPPCHRVLMGRRAVRQMARLADLKLVRFRTATHPYPATASAQLNALGLGAVVPEGAAFSNEISSRGVRLTGWAKLLWDWRGKGDMMYAVLQAI